MVPIPGFDPALRIVTPNLPLTRERLDWWLAQHRPPGNDPEGAGFRPYTRGEMKRRLAELACGLEEEEEVVDDDDPFNGAMELSDEDKEELKKLKLAEKESECRKKKKRIDEYLHNWEVDEEMAGMERKYSDDEIMFYCTRVEPITDEMARSPTKPLRRAPPRHPLAVRQPEQAPPFPPTFVVHPEEEAYDKSLAFLPRTHINCASASPEYHIKMFANCYLIRSWCKLSHPVVAATLFFLVRFFEHDDDEHDEVFVMPLRTALETRDGNLNNPDELMRWIINQEQLEYCVTTQTLSQYYHVYDPTSVYNEGDF
jgi:hypothetical protein